MASIYNISTWSTGTTYSKNDIVKYGTTTTYYFYSLVDNNVGIAPAISSNTWGGVANLNGVDKPVFNWTPSYNFNVSSAPLVRSIRFGEGYEQRLREGLNNNLIKIDLNFDKRNLKEATAIIHFLSERAAAESFIFTVPDPYSVRKLFVARDWAVSQVFINNFTVTAVFEEVPF